VPRSGSDANDDLTLSREGLRVIARWEGYRPHWYKDSAGVWTIGYGTTAAVPGVSRDSLSGPISKDDALVLLRRGAEGASRCIRDSVGVHLEQPEFDALVSFVYNVGCPALRRSTLLKHLNAGRTERAAQEFGRWVYAGGQLLEGLKRRREAEKRLFLQDPDWQSIDVPQMPAHGVVTDDVAVDTDRLTPRRIDPPDSPHEPDATSGGGSAA
jgi:lysozyme